jgi:hypothetical protein
MTPEERNFRDTQIEIRDLIENIYKIEILVSNTDFHIGLLENRMYVKPLSRCDIETINYSIDILEEHKKEMLDNLKKLKEKYNKYLKITDDYIARN